MFTKVFFSIFILLLLGAANIFAQRAIEQTVKTSVGTVEFARVGDPTQMPNQWQIKLGDEVLYDVPESYGGLQFEKLFKSFAGKEDVIVFSESEGGNACAVAHRILAIRPDKTHFLSEAIDNCITPKFVQEGDKLVLKFPRMPVMRGTGFVPAETWVYQNGKLQMVKTVRRVINKR